MSRIGNRIIKIPTNISVLVDPQKVTITDQKRSLVVWYNCQLVQVSVGEQTIKTQVQKANKAAHAQQGTINALLNNGIIGLTTGFQKTLTIIGAGYRAAVSDNDLILTLGYSHPINLPIPANIELKLLSPTEIHLTSFDRELLGEFTARIRK